jgi:hypothetical protein
MNEISKDATPRANFRVRRRRYDTTSWLVDRNTWYQIDELADTVWLSCEDGFTVEQIAHEVARRHQLPLGEALAGTVGLLLHFRALGLVALDE